MKFLLITNYFPPEIGAASHLFFDLATEMKKRGHNVFVLTGFPRYNVKIDIYRNYLNTNRKVVIENISGMKVIRTYVPYFSSKNILSKGVEHIALPFYFLRGIKYLSEKIDAAFICSPPIALSLVGKYVKRRDGSKVILGIQDIFPQNAIDVGLLKDPFSIGFFRLLEAYTYRIVDHITVHSESNAEYLMKYAKIPFGKISVVYNWVDTEFIKPLPKNNSFSQKNQLVQRFVVSFAGTMGISQDMDVILKAAQRLKNYNEIVFLLVGDGLKKKRVEEFVRKENLANVKLLPMQPKSVYPWILASSDVSLVTLTTKVRTPVVPSKILSIMAAGRPIVASLPLDGDAPKLIKSAKAGIVVAPGDDKGLADAILHLYNNPKLREQFGNNGRKFAVNNLGKKVCIDKLEQVISKVIQGGHTRSQL